MKARNSTFLEKYKFDRPKDYYREPFTEKQLQYNITGSFNRSLHWSHRKFAYTYSFFKTTWRKKLKKTIFKIADIPFTKVVKILGYTKIKTIEAMSEMEYRSKFNICSSQTVGQNVEKYSEYFTSYSVE